MLEISSQEQLERELNTEFAVVVEFTQARCQPCKKMGIVLQAVESEHLDVKFFVVDVERFPGLAGLYGVQSTPVTAIFRGGKIKEHIIGVKNKDYIKELLAK